MARKSSKKVVPFTGAELDRAVLFVLRLKDVAQRDIDNYLICIGRKEESPNSLKFSRYTDIFNRLWSIQISRKLELDQRSIPLYETSDVDFVLADLANFIADEDIPKERVELFCRSFKDTIASEVKRSNDQSEPKDLYQEFWDRLNLLREILKERSIDLSQAQPTIELYDEITRRQFSRDKLANELKKITDIINDEILGSLIREIFSSALSVFADDLSQDEIDEFKNELFKNKDIVDAMTSAIGELKKTYELANQYTINRIYGEN